VSDELKHQKEEKDKLMSEKKALEKKNNQVSVFLLFVENEIKTEFFLFSLMLA
jgi:hypothetical protein